MTEEQDDAMAELDATRKVYETLKPLSPDAQERVLHHISGLLKMGGGTRRQDEMNEVQEAADIEREEKEAPKFSTFADLFDAAEPKTQAQRALVAGYWLQVCQESESFDGFSANKVLKQLGHGLDNVTIAINALKKEKPALALQIGKSGKTQQARKTYKLAIAGIKSVEAMING